MNTKPILIGLTLLNLALLVFLLLSHATPTSAADPLQVLRGRGLEIVDDNGKVRASITVHPAAFHKPSNRNYPETVVLRLIDQNGRPEIKISASVDGGGVTCIGVSDTTQAMLHAEEKNSFLKLQNADGKVQWYKP